MLELQKRIDRWRREMLRSLDAEVVEELEAHLQEAAEEFLRLGRGDAEAFDMAVRQLGSVQELAAEFGGRGGWRVLAWARVVSLVGMIGLFAMGVAIGLKGGLDRWLLGAHIFTITAGYLGAFLVGAIGICFVWQQVWRPMSPSGQAAAARETVRYAAWSAVFTAIGVGFGMAWTELAWGRLWDWNFREIGGLAIFLWLLVHAGVGHSEWVSVRGLMLMGIVGNVVVLFGWFAASALDFRQWGGAMTGLVWGGAVFHLLIALAAILPVRERGLANTR